MDVGVPSLKRICVLKVVEEIRHFCSGVPFDELGKCLYIVGPFEYLSSPCTEAIFEYVASTRQLNSSWLSLLLVTHLRTVDLHACPSVANNSLFKLLLHRCKRLEKLIIPNCTRISNKKLCEVLLQNPSLLHLDISNKLSPKVDSTVVDTLAHSCRNLRVLKLSDHRLDDPKGLLVLCGRVPVATPSRGEPEEEWNVGAGGKRERVVACPNPLESSAAAVQSSGDWRRSDSGLRGKPLMCSCLPTAECVHGRRVQEGEEEGEGSGSLEPLAMMANNLSLEELGATDIPRQRTQEDDGAQCSNVNRLLSIGSLEGDGSLLEGERGGDRASWSRRAQSNGLQRFNSGSCSDSDPLSSSLVMNGLASPVGQPDGVLLAGRNWTLEEQENAISNHQRGHAIGRPPGGIVDHPGARGQENGSNDGSDENESESEEEDLYEDDDNITDPLAVEDRSAEFGCMELETLCLDYINLDDQVLAVLMQSLPRLRFLNVSDTNIHNPWRLLDAEKSTHLKYLCHLDVRSTALSRTALPLIPKFHPDLQKLSISTTMLPPCTYASIGRLTGVADLELIGGQYYPAPPEDIFKNGIAPAVSSIGKHLVSLNLTFFAHVEFESIVLNCPKIESLDLSYTTISLTHPSPSLATCCPHLTCLNLAFSHVKATKKQEDNKEPEPVPEDVALQKMIGVPPNLEELCLDGLSIQDETLQGVFSGLSHPLRVLNVSKCNMLSIVGVEHVWTRCPHLKTIDLTHCRAITLADHERFTEKCQRERPRFRVEGRIKWK